jgi:hypothetical protein
MLRSSAAFSKSIFFAAFAFPSSNVLIISLDFLPKIHRLEDTLAV